MSRRCKEVVQVNYGTKIYVLVNGELWWKECTGKRRKGDPNQEGVGEVVQMDMVAALESTWIPNGMYHN